MDIFIIKALQFFLSISLLVFLHEGGHMFFAKLFGVRVDKFFVFFDLGIGKWSGALFKWKPKNSDTTYGIGWLPFGGYCKIAGMVDESLDTEQLKQPAQEWELRSKPAWQRLFVMMGGIIVNFVLAMILYSAILFTWGDEYIALKDMRYGMKFNNEAKALGFRDGDILLKTDLGELKAFDADLFRDLSKAKEVTVLRAGEQKRIPLPGNLDLLNMLKSTPKFMEPLLPAFVVGVVKGSPAEGVIPLNTKILALNGNPIDSYNTLMNELQVLRDQMSVAKTSADSLKLRTVNVVYRWGMVGHDIRTKRIVLTPDLKMGVELMTPYSLYLGKETHVSYSFWESIPAGIAYGWNVLSGYVSDLKYVFSSDGVKSLGGFGTLGGMFPATWDWHAFWLITAFFSIILAFMNFLPIPALDGGHVLFILYEIITGRKPSENFLIKAEYVGFAILVTLMVVANLNDVLRMLGISW